MGFTHVFNISIDLCHFTFPLFCFRSDLVLRGFLETYDVSWKSTPGVSLGHLPSSWESCRGVHADNETRLGTIIIELEGSVQHCVRSQIDVREKKTFLN